MNGQTSNLPPPLPTESNAKPQRTWRWLKIAAAITLGLVLIVKIISSSNFSSMELQLTREYSDGTVVRIINVGDAPIRILKVTVNDRADCKVGLLDLLRDSKGVPADLNIGDKLELWSPSCPIIRAHVETDKGSKTYRFSPN
jgi:hypothetical protein